MLKKEIRKEYIKKRNGISYNEKIKWDDLLLIQFQTVDFPFLDAVLSFYPIESKNEINSILLTDYLHFKNPSLQICYPRTNFTDTSMDAVVCQADSIFQENATGILEPVGNQVMSPEDLDMVIVPLLAFDCKGQRVGYGKGFFDRYLSLCREDCIKVGVSYFDPVETIEDANDYDVPLNFCITPQRAYVF